PFRREIVEQGFEHPTRFVIQEKGGIEQIDSDDPERLLLKLVFPVKHSYVNDDLALFIARMDLVFHPHPAMAFVRALIVTRCDRVVECEKRGAVTPLRL